MTTFDKLRERIKKELDIDAANFKRNYVGHWQRSRGAWVWVANKVFDGLISPYDVGSSYSAKYLLNYKGKLTICRDGEIVPDN